MKLPNAVSVAAIVGIIALCEGLADTLPALGQPWVPFAVIALGALVKGLQVYAQERRTNGEVRTAAERKKHNVLRRVLVD